MNDPFSVFSSLNFYAGLSVAYVIGFISLEILKRWNTLISIFSPTKKVTMANGPSPFDTFKSSLEAAIQLGVIVVLFYFSIMFVSK